MGNPSSDSYRNVTRYTGQDYSFAPRYIRPRDPKSPTSASTDIKPKENQGYYPTGSFWTNSTNGNLWALQKITSNLANWILLSGTAGPLLNIVVPNGTSPVVPDGSGTITYTSSDSSVTITGSTNAIDFKSTGGQALTNITVPNGVSPIVPNGSGTTNFTSSAGTITITGSSAMPNNHTINFDLVGGTAAIDSVQVDASTAPGTNPVLPTVAGLMTVTGAQVAAGVVGANVIRTDSLAANTYTVEIQRSTAVGATASVNNGVSHFNSANFTVDANGFVSLAAIFSVNIQTFTSNGTYTPTTGMAYCIIEVMGAGGAGGGAPTTAGSNTACGSGGGSGEYARGVFSAATIGVSQTVTIGAGGTGVSGANGNNGGNTSVGALISAFGGTGGLASGAGSAIVTTVGQAGGIGGSGGNFRFLGFNGGHGVSAYSAGVSIITGHGGDGANSAFAAGGRGALAAGNGGGGFLYGGGGGGAVTFSSAASTGGPGGAGVVVITEYIVT